MKNIFVGLIGLGTVGTGTAKILLKNQSLIGERLGARIVLKKIADLDIKRDRGIQFSPGTLTRRVQEVLEDPEIQIVIELIGGIEPARTFILDALKRGKHVVTANKALLAQHGKEIFAEARKNRCAVAFEASVAGGIPILRSIREGLVGNHVKSLYGILNGTSNFILSKMTEEGREFTEVLKEAQTLGYAEADPTLDIEGIDAAHKLAILLYLTHGITVGYEKIYREGISSISALDIQFAGEFGFVIKLLGIFRETKKGLEARVHPVMVSRDHLLASVRGAYNAIYLQGDAVGNLLFYGLGAGMMPTGSSVVGDLVELAHHIQENSQVPFPSASRKKPPDILPIQELVSRYYFRFSAMDRPGVLSKISGILGKNGISIASVIQKGREIKGAVPIVMMTHEAREADMRKALKTIDRLDVVKRPTLAIRVQEFNFI